MEQQLAGEVRYLHHRRVLRGVNRDRDQLIESGATQDLGLGLNTAPMNMWHGNTSGCKREHLTLPV